MGGWTLDGGPMTQKIAACAFDAINHGYYYGLKLNDVYYDSKMVYFEWCGTKRAMMTWYTYVSVNMMREPEDERKKVLEIISNK